jgi:hypothetical protein
MRVNSPLVKKNKMRVDMSLLKTFHNNLLSKMKTFHNNLLSKTKIRVLAEEGTLGCAAASRSKIKMKNELNIK